MKLVFTVLTRSLLVTLGLLGTAAAAETAPLSLSWVSHDKFEFDPSKKEKATIRYRVSQPATITVHIVNPFGERVRIVKNEPVTAGDNKFEWDGRDDQKRIVDPEAYTYTLTAVSQTTNERVTYDLGDKTGGETVYAGDAKIDQDGNVTYTLQQNSRVRTFISSTDTSWPVAALTDWAPRASGPQKETWDGWDVDHVVNARQMSKTFTPIVYAFALPQNAIIVKGTPAKPATKTKVDKKIPPVDGSAIPTRVSTAERSVHLHATHARARCYNPKIVSQFSDGGMKGAKDIAVINKPTALSFSISPEQAENRVQPISRVSVFIFVDGTPVERLLVGYEPYQWIIDPAKLTPGEHVITGLFTWREDHFGITHRKVRVEATKELQKISAPNSGT